MVFSQEHTLTDIIVPDNLQSIGRLHCSHMCLLRNDRTNKHSKIMMRTGTKDWTLEGCI